MRHTCGGCPTTWTGLNICHCSACHETFSTIQWFDAHRFRGVCRDPAGLTRGAEGKDTREPLLKRNKQGFWVGFQSRPKELNVA